MLEPMVSWHAIAARGERAAAMLGGALNDLRRRHPVSSPVGAIDRADGGKSPSLHRIWMRRFGHP